MKEIKEELNKWEEIMHLWIEIFNIINLFIFPKFIYRFNAKFEQDSYSKIYVERSKPENS